MKYIPKILSENVNISTRSPLKELALLLSGLSVILLIIYVALGLTVNYAVSKVPPGLEKHLGQLFEAPFADKSPTPAEIFVQNLLDELVELSGLEKGAYNVSIAPFHKPNAFALPGGRIVIFSALLQEIESENELNFILAHELGHFAARDHLRGLGRTLTLTVLSVFLLGKDSILSDFCMRSLLNVEMKFSQQQENQADMFALELLYQRYDHISGATDFIEKIMKEEHGSRFKHFFSTHPYPQDRIDLIQQQARKKGYGDGERTPLNEVVKNIPDYQGTAERFQWF